MKKAVPVQGAIMDMYFSILSKDATVRVKKGADLALELYVPGYDSPIALEIKGETTYWYWSF